ncbi:unnamed protein product (plasmid) [Mycetohabitans rhizoxinica HKI 454]|uniref:Uncharacterized protein n=1 Tax=Mycetohabitans rhizoxinica (strain DSM 19002 / CIP 109453 / HKI 454) TaxID=882378 RepID=E5AVC1_MYCRK|nr:unnamed protein product [Mycetohabitans rhizoxinica HKI 454]
MVAQGSWRWRERVAGSGRNTTETLGCAADCDPHACIIHVPVWAGGDTRFGVIRDAAFTNTGFTLTSAAISAFAAR